MPSGRWEQGTLGLGWGWGFLWWGRHRVGGQWQWAGLVFQVVMVWGGGIWVRATGKQCWPAQLLSSFCLGNRMHHLGTPTLCQGLNKTAEWIIKIECET